MLSTKYWDPKPFLLPPLLSDYFPFGGGFVLDQFQPPPLEASLAEGKGYQLTGVLYFGIGGQNHRYCFVRFAVFHFCQVFPQIFLSLQGLKEGNVDCQGGIKEFLSP